MAEVASAFVTLIPSFRGGGRAITREVDGQATAAGRSGGKKAGAGFASSFSSSLKGMIGVGILAGAGAALYQGFMGATSAASDLQETVSKSNVIFGKNARQIDAWSKTAAQSLGLSRQEALEAAAGFGDMFSQLGFAGGDAASMAKDVVGLSADLGSFNNLPTADVADRISAAFRGEYDSLQALIPNINAARVEQEALAATGKSSAKELTAQEKAAATLAIVQKDGARAVGDFARTSDGAANKQKILSARLADLKARAGEALLPIKTMALEGFLRLLDLGERLGPTFQAIGRFFAPVIESVKRFFASARAGENAQVSTHFETMRTTMSRVGEVIKEVARVAGPILAQAFRTLGPPIMEASTAVAGLVAAIAQRLLPLIRFFAPYAKTAFSAIFAVAGPMLKNLAALIRVVTAVIKGDWSGAWRAIRQIFATNSKALGSIVRGLGRAVVKALSGAWSLMKTGASAAWNGLKSLVGNAAGALRANAVARIQSLRQSVQTAWAQMRQNASDSWNRIRAMVTGAVTGMRSAVTERIRSMVETVRGLPGRATAALGNLGGLLVEKGKALIQGLIDGIRAKIGDVGSAMGDIAGKIGGFLPGSPVREGPLTSWNNGGAGKRLMGLLTDGIRSATPDVGAAVRQAVTFDESRENDASYVKWWRGLIAQGWRGRPGDGAERLYAPAAASAAASAVRGARVASSRSSSHRGPSLTSQDLEAMGRAAGRAMASQVVPGVSSAIRDRARDERQHAHASSFTGGR